MAELTKEQLQAACDAMNRVTLGGAFEKLSAAALYLQLPWDYCTDLEATVYEKVRLQHGTQAALNDFITRRNTALMPKPVDKRREKIVAILDAFNRVSVPSYPSDIADKILAALEGAQ